MLYIPSSKKVNNSKLLQPIRCKVLHGRISTCSGRRRSSPGDKVQKYAVRTATTKTGDDPKGVPCSFCAKAIPLSAIERRLERNVTVFRSTHIVTSHTSIPIARIVPHHLSRDPGSPGPDPKMLRAGHSFNPSRNVMICLNC